MKKVPIILFFGVILSCLSFLYGKNPVLVISLGSDCEVAHQLRRRGLISSYLPLDWVRSSNFDKVFELIKNDFIGFLDDSCLEEKGINEVDSPPKKAVLDTYYELLFVHDFDLDQPIKSNSEVKEKYDRRITRFREIMKLHGTILFFRKGMTYQQGKRLSQLLSHKWPHIKHMVVALGETPDMKQPWINLPYVRNFYLKEIAWPPAHGWEENNERWDEILKELKLTKD